MDFIVIVIIMICTLIGMVLGYCMRFNVFESEKFHAGDICINLSPDPMEDLIRMELNCDIRELMVHDEVYFQIIRNIDSQEKPRV